MTAKRQALGRGLGALLSGADDVATAKVQAGAENNTGQEVSADQSAVIGAIAAIDIELIEVNPFQPRTVFDEEAIKELSESIKVSGLIQPITVRKQGKKYQIISGERRYRASKMAGLNELPAYIRMANDNEVLEMALVENIQRENLNAIDIALSYQALMDACSFDSETISERVGKNRSTVSNYLRLLKLPAEIQLALKDDRISMGHARAIINVESPEKQLDIVRGIIEKSLSVRQVEDLVRNISHSSTQGKESVEKLHPKWCGELEEKLKGKYPTKIEIKANQKGKGRVSFYFESEDQLREIFGL